MHQLILLRHAKAARGSAELTDHDRPLTQDGKKAAAAMGAAMRRLGLTPDVVLLSTSLRTQETLDALEPWDDRPNIESLPNLYMASYQQIREVLRELPETVRSVLVIGHNPGIHDLAQLLAGEGAKSGNAGPASPEFVRLADEYPTASLCEFSIATLWQKIGPAGACLKRFIQPSDLPLTAR
jgi:phosphohistidine phosphatase